MSKPTRLLDATAMHRALHRMASEIVEQNHGTNGLVVVGIQRRGVELAERIAAFIEESEGVVLPRGKLDITLYRDDLQTVGPRPIVNETSLPASLDGASVIIVDDVLYTGRTARAALDEVADFGRPRRIWLCVLVDRGGRELPIQADVVGAAFTVSPGDQVEVLLAEVDGQDAVNLIPGATSSGKGPET